MPLPGAEWQELLDEDVGATAQRRGYLFRLPASAAEPDDIPISFVGGTTRYGWAVLAVRSDTGQLVVIDVAPVQNDADSGTTRTIPGVDPSGPGVWLTYVGELNIQSGNTPPLPSGMTSIAATGTVSGGHGLRLARQTLADGTAQSAKTVSGPNDRWCASSLVIAEQAPPGNPGAWLPFFP